MTGVCAGLALLCAAGSATSGSAGAPDPYRAYREAHPEVGEEELLEVAAGDSLARVLAALHHPAAGFEPTALWFAPEAQPVSFEAALARGRSEGILVAAVAQRCTRKLPGTQGAPFSSWFLLEKGGLRAWSLQPFTAECRPEDPLLFASDHRVMRVVGEELFARARSGQFRYGPLVFEEWDEAFASPTPAAMLSRLRATAGARPHDAHAQNRLAVGQYASGEREPALAALERAVRLAPSWPVPHRNLAVAHRQRGDLAAAARAREHAEWLAGSAVGSGP